VRRSSFPLACVDCGAVLLLRLLLAPQRVSSFVAGFVSFVCAAVLLSLLSISRSEGCS
jgi:hypothetical protein